MSERNAFEVLGLAPTCDMGVVKRAYFAALSRCPPQSDPEGFRIVRAAYETLSKPHTLAAAYVAAPIDIAPLKRAYAERFDDKIRAAVQRAASQQSAAASVEQLVERLSTCSWNDACNLAAQAPDVTASTSPGA